jgi:hypothetical protein
MRSGTCACVGLTACVLAVTALVGPLIAAESVHTLGSAPAPVDNPLKGLVPYSGDGRGSFPHSLEFNTLPYSALVKGYDDFDWQPLETLLDDIAGRGHQAILRIYLEYPGRPGVIPEFLIKDGLKIHAYLNTNTAPFPPALVETPDYENQNLRRSLKAFIAAFGKKYDGDPRLGFVTAGLLGTWGEWHTYPRSELFASKAVQIEVMEAYEAAFKLTPVLLRYPAGDDTFQKAKNADRPFGYHDDSFAWATLDTGKDGDKWFFMTALAAAGADAESKWKTEPIGGEIRPEAWGKVFDERPADPAIQNIRTCVETTHASWLLDSGMFGEQPDGDRVRRAEALVRGMGYDFHCPKVTIGAVAAEKVAVRLEIVNRGVAPFYYDWKGEWGLLSDGKVVQAVESSGTLTGLLPGEAPTAWTDTLDVKGVKAGTYTLAVRVPNPLPTGKPLRFANNTQDVDAPGWLSLGTVRIPD